jgi:hypothetical protein
MKGDLMKKIAVIGLFAGLALCGGCLRTMAPILEDKDLIADEAVFVRSKNNKRPG